MPLSSGAFHKYSDVLDRTPTPEALYRSIQPLHLEAHDLLRDPAVTAAEVFRADSIYTHLSGTERQLRRDRSAYRGLTGHEVMLNVLADLKWDYEDRGLLPFSARNDVQRERSELARRTLQYGRDVDGGPDTDGVLLLFGVGCRWRALQAELAYEQGNVQRGDAIVAELKRRAQETAPFGKPTAEYEARHERRTARELAVPRQDTFMDYKRHAIIASVLGDLYRRSR